MRSALRLLLIGIFFSMFLDLPATWAGEAILKVGIEKVAIYDYRKPICEISVSVVDSKGKVVKDLSPSDFQIDLDGLPAGRDLSVSTFLSSGRQLEYLVLFETRENMATSFSMVRSGLSDLFRNFGYRHKGAAACYTGGYRLLTGFTTNASTLTAAMTDLNPTEGRPGLIDGLLSGVQDLADAPLGEDGPVDRRVLILLTEGLDEGSLFALESLAQRVRETGISLYVIAYGLSDNSTLKYLENLSQQTHGGYWVAQPEEIRPILMDIADRLNQEYVLNFIYDNQKLDGSMASLSLLVSSRSGQGKDHVRFFNPKVERLSLEWLGGLVVAALAILLILTRSSKKQERLNQKPNSSKS